MASDKKYLFSTRPLPKAVVDEAAKKGVVIEELTFISVSPIKDNELFEKLNKLSLERHVVVFTSMNAVGAVATAATSAPFWKIYCIGNTTRKLIEEKFGTDKIVGTAENAQRLGERLIDDGVKEAVFFCGNIRRDELPNKIRSEGGKIEEVVVYNTKETPVTLEKNYDGILFFSPSAVDAFYKKNIPATSAVLFAIGKTTAEALRNKKAKKVIVGSNTDKTELAMEAVEYLLKNTD